ncbi:MAG TPA: type IV pilus assembly protein PilM [Solirubrobacterales bacterium]|jgi:type IV pilus assembly protein PilM
MAILTRKSSKDSRIVGLEIEAGSIGAAEVVANGSVHLEASGSVPLPAEAFRDGEIRDPASVAAALRSLFDEQRLSRRVRLGIANSRVVVRTIRMPAIDDPKELDAAVRFMAQEQIPMPLDQAVLDHRMVGGVPQTDGAPPQIDVMVIAARRDMVSAFLAPLREAGLEPVGVDLSAFAMIRAVADPRTFDGATEGERPTSAVLYCSVGDVTNLAVAKGRSCLFTRVSSTGMDDIASSLQGRTGLSPEHAAMWLSHVGLEQPVEAVAGDAGIVAETRQALERGASALVDEIRLSLDFYGAQETAMPVDRIVLCGPGSAIAGLPEQMEPTLEMPISSARPEALDGLDALAAARLTLPLGLALDS